MRTAERAGIRYFDVSSGLLGRSSNRCGLLHPSLLRWRPGGRHRPPSTTESVPFRTESAIDIECQITSVVDAHGRGEGGGGIGGAEGVGEGERERERGREMVGGINFSHREQKADCSWSDLKSSQLQSHYDVSNAFGKIENQRTKRKTTSAESPQEAERSRTWLDSLEDSDSWGRSAPSILIQDCLIPILHSRRRLKCLPEFSELISQLQESNQDDFQLLRSSAIILGCFELGATAEWTNEAIEILQQQL